MSEWKRWVAESNVILHRDSKDPRIFIVGEYSHYDERAIEQQLELATLLHPKYIIHESFKNFVFSSSNRKLTEDPEYKKDEEALKYWLEHQSPRTSKCTYSSSFLPKFLRKEGICISEDCKVSKADLRSLIKNYGIEIELPPHLDGGYFYLTNWWPFIKYCIDNNADLVGCDLSEEDGAYRVKRFDKDVNIGKLSVSPELISDREHRAANVISAYARKATPVLSIHGSYHIRPGSDIFTVLERDGLTDYVVIEQISKEQK